LLDELWESVLEEAFKVKEGEEWREVRFLEKVDLIKGIKPKKVFKEPNKNTLPYLTTDYFRSNKVEEYVLLDDKITKVKKGDLVVIADGSRSGELFKCDIEGVLCSTMAKFVFNDNEIDKNYLFWFLTAQFENLNESKYTATPHINKQYLKTLKLPLPFRNGKPDLETQKKIVEYIEENFSRIDKILEKKKRELELLDELWESVLEEAFKVKEGEEWREVRLGEIADHFMGGTPKTSVDEYWDGNIPWITAKEFSNSEVYITKPTRYITEKGLKESNAQIAPKYSILLVTTASVGNVAIAGIDLAINQQITAIIPNQDVFFKYLYYYFVKNAKKLLVRGHTTFKHINQKFISKLPILIPFRNGKPDLEKQKEISNYLDNVYEKIKTLKEKIQKQITLLEEMKESILDEAFNHSQNQAYFYQIKKYHNLNLFFILKKQSLDLPKSPY